MKYTLFDDHITLQSLLKDLRIIQSGGAIKSFLQDNVVLVNNEKEMRRRRKLRLLDTVTIPELETTITITQPSDSEIKERKELLSEKERVTKIVRKINQESNFQKVRTNKKQKPRFPGM
ncbi:RNA-binding S4 domain-containing protein [Streptococcus sciuri]|uniref:RNA-binding S4 domain-containing protein n=1 Tax=Streptococcus sciuri TaxID=2973939 RepID=A0ABT2F6B0_9STRE|nr:RNA-binding S4 domain-containing protein [Streptococcus sciuri]MCS4487964.1 RNA-binding S4 domain-containing protein [Streptococcus sciuri]